MKYTIAHFGYYDPAPTEFTKTQALAELKLRAHQDLADCRSRFGTGKLTWTGPTSYRIEFGLNIYSAGHIETRQCV